MYSTNINNECTAPLTYNFAVSSSLIDEVTTVKVNASSFGKKYPLQEQFISNASYVSCSDDTSTDIKLKNSALIYVLNLDLSGQTKIASKYMMIAIERYFSKNEIFYVNKILSDKSIIELSPLILVGLIRATYRAKSFLPAWSNAYFRVEKSLKNKGLDTKRLFVGIRN